MSKVDRIILTNAQAKIIETLRLQSPLTYEAIMSNTGYSYPGVRNQMKILRLHGYVNKMRRGNTIMWELRKNANLPKLKGKDEYYTFKQAFDTLTDENYLERMKTASKWAHNYRLRSMAVIYAQPMLLKATGKTYKPASLNGYKGSLIGHATTLETIAASLRDIATRIMTTDLETFDSWFRDPDYDPHFAIDMLLKYGGKAVTKEEAEMLHKKFPNKESE